MNETMHEKLTQAIATMTQTPTNENLFAVLQQLGDMLEAGAGVLVPADRMPDEPDQEEDRIQYRMLQGSDGTPLLVCFTAQAELERVTAEKEALETENASLTQSIETLTSTNEELASTNRRYVTKSKFMDAYVVFVENDGTGYYHKYGCDYFAQTSFWAYSRKLAEANGYTPCPHCFG